MSHRLNLARRPFIDTRPVNVAAGLLAGLVLVLSFISVRTVVRYLEDSRKTRDAIAELRTEISGLEEARRGAEASVARYDLDEMQAAAEDANLIALRRAFSWSRFLGRLERTLPPDVRIVSIALTGAEKAAPAGRKDVRPGSFGVEMVLVSRTPDGLPKTVRAFYASPFFDRPSPHVEDRGDKRAPDGRRLSIAVVYRDLEDPR